MSKIRIIVLVFIILSLTGCPDKPDDNNQIIIIKKPAVDATIEEIIAEQLENQEGTLENPADLIIDIDLGRMIRTGDFWEKILYAIEEIGKYVNLDLTDCTVEDQSYNYFNPNYTVTAGKDKIVNLIIPDIITHIVAGTGAIDYPFKHFTNLETVSAANVFHIGSFAFYENTSIKRVFFPKVTEIILSSFYGCTNLEEADFPLAVTIGDNSFSRCTNLLRVNLPELTRINPFTFYNCINLSEINITKATHIDQYAFYGCESLIEANFPLITTLGNYAFSGCKSLESVNFPLVDIIYPNAFSGCISLTEIASSNFESAFFIASNAFYGCENLVSVTFKNVVRVNPEAFGNCTKLETARFLADPERTTYPAHPLDPWIERSGIDQEAWTQDSVVFQFDAFINCVSLRVLDVRNAWNVFFVASSLANIGTHLDLYLFDDDGTRSYGHPVISWFLGDSPDGFGGPRTITSLNLILPKEAPIPSKIFYHHPHPQPGYHGIRVQLGDANQYGSHVTVNVLYE